MPKITFFLPESKTGIVVEAAKGTTILNAALSAQLPIENDCGGCCSCGTCHVTVLSGGETLSQQKSEERSVLRCAKSVDAQSRLGCQSVISGDVSVRLK